MIQQGNCPKCGERLEYSGNRHESDEGMEYECMCPKCGFSGEEHYTLKFDGFRRRQRLR